MTRLYRGLLCLYPRAFRARYGAEMTRAFDDRRQAAARRGAAALAIFHLAALRDLIVNALGERAARSGPGPRRPDDQPVLASIAQDVGDAVRAARRRPALTIFTSATFALGVGAVTAVMAVADAVLLQPLPFPQPHAIVAVRGIVDGVPAGLSWENLADVRAASRSLTAVTPFFTQSVNLTGVAEPDRVRGAFVTSDFFDVFATSPAIGARFTRQHDVPNSERVVVLTDGAWRRRFGGSRQVIGRQLTLNNTAFTVLGVMPPGFTVPIDYAEVFVPIWTAPVGLDRASHNYFAVGRLAEEVSVSTASLELAAIAADLERRFPAVNRGRGAVVHPLHDVLTAGATSPLALLLVMAGIVLLAACGSVAGLELGAAASRRQELSVRAALGAGRGRLVRQLLVESALRALVGAAAGIAAAWALVRIVVSHAPVEVLGLAQATVSPVVAAAAGGAALVAGLGAGLPPAWKAARAGVLPGDRVAGDRGMSRIRGALVVAQITLAAALIVTSGLLTRSFARLASIDPGFAGDRVLSMEYRLPRNKYTNARAQAAFHAAVLDRVRAIPGVEDAALIRALPFSGNGNAATFRLSGSDEPREALLNTASLRYFETMGIPIVAGRAFAAADAARPVVVVSRAFAARFWPSIDPIGQVVRFDEVDITAEVIGVAGDVRHRTLALADPGTIYTLDALNPGVFNTLVVRTAGDPLTLADTVRRAVWSVDPDQPVWKVRTVASLVDQSVATRRFLLQLIASFGISAAVLAVAGLYGVVSAGVARRQREIGVRLALGATRGAVLRLVVARGLSLAAAGVAAGLAGAAAAGSILERFLFGVTARDPLTYAAAAALLLASALAACWLPARRALRVDPAMTLREG